MGKKTDTKVKAHRYQSPETGIIPISNIQFFPLGKYGNATWLEHGETLEINEGRARIKERNKTQECSPGDTS